MGPSYVSHPYCNNLGKVLTDPARRSTIVPQAMGRPTPSNAARRTARHNQLINGIPNEYHMRKEKYDLKFMSLKSDVPINPPMASPKGHQLQARMRRAPSCTQLTSKLRLFS